MKEFNDLVRDGGGLPDFSAVTFRTGAAFTAEFGLDGTFDVLRLHPAVDRGHGAIYAPFRCRARFIPDRPDRFGNLLIMETPYGFDVRVAHMERLSEVASALVAAGAEIPAGTYMGEAGRAGLVQGVDGRHTHTEIVSQGRTCPALDLVLEEKVGRAFLVPYADEEVVEYCQGQGFTGSPLLAYAQQRMQRGISLINDYICDKVDYLSQQPRRLYSSVALFGM